jgi:hypothetical protein
MGAMPAAETPNACSTRFEICRLLALSCCIYAAALLLLLLLLLQSLRVTWRL